MEWSISILPHPSAGGSGKKQVPECVLLFREQEAENRRPTRVDFSFQREQEKPMTF
jgi:hypothetical protein